MEIIKSTDIRSPVIIAIYGTTNVGKTSLITTLSPEDTLYVSVERQGIMPFKKPFNTVEINSERDFEELLIELGKLNWVKNVFIDSFSDVSKLVLLSSEKETKTSKGTKDNRATYGRLGSKLTKYIHRMRDFKDTNFILLAKETVKETDELVSYKCPEVDGNKGYLAYIHDTDLLLRMVSEGGERFFLTECDNETFVVKKRGLEIEPKIKPDLGDLLKVIAKSKSN